ncbi:MAG: helix-turn-helix transcriptional regulator [Clostridiales bacterium]|nr:helix-turn-helix transcriptional regulator [Clostridiales bacterium]
MFSTRLKELREERQLSQKDISRKLGCAVSTYANWEQGRTEPSIYDIYNLLWVFDIEANELFNVMT